MSIIYDALKKVEAKVGIPGGKDAAGALSEKKPLNVKLFVLCGVVACLGLVIAHLLFSAFVSPMPKHEEAQAGSSLPGARVVQQTPAVTPSVQPVAVTKVEIPQANEPEPAEAEESPRLVLNGVFFSQDGGYALVNNKIVSQGEEIDGAKLVEIGEDEVLFDFKGKEIRLSTRK